MENLKPTLVRRINVINDNLNISNNVNTVNNGEETNREKYALNRSKFTPNTEETQLAEEIAYYFSDLDNYAFYLHVVNQLGISGTRIFWASIKQEIQEKNETRFAIRNQKKYFAWRFRKGLIT